MRINGIFCKIAYSLFLILMLSACARDGASPAKITPSLPKSMVIYEAMTRNYDGPHGILNIYVDLVGFSSAQTRAAKSGQEDPGLKATLWLVIVDHPETYTSFEVKTGQMISFEGYEINILRIGEGEQHYVEVEVHALKEEPGQ